MIASLAGVAGTFLGGTLASVVPKKLSPFLSAAAGGVMLAVVTLELLPEATSRASVISAVVSVTAGLLLVEGLRLLLDNGEKTARMKMRSRLLFFAVALHNLPEGLAIGATAVDGSFAVALLIALHNVPEGLAVAAPMIEDGVTRPKAALLAGLSGVPTVVGAVAGALLAEASGFFVAPSLALAAGAMLYVVFCEMNNSSELGAKKYGIAQTAGFMAAFVLINII